MSSSDIQKQWEKVLSQFSNHTKNPITIEGLLLLIGIQEFNILKDNYSKEEKIDLIHIGMCCILENDGYYQFSHYDKDKWPHYNTLKPLPEMNHDTEDLFIKEKIIAYCIKHKLI
ncbi:MAG: hypothetical protein ACRCR9_02515 [Chitinophagaceae bacterium]